MTKIRFTNYPFIIRGRRAQPTVDATFTRLLLLNTQPAFSLCQFPVHHIMRRLCHLSHRRKIQIVCPAGWQDRQYSKGIKIQCLPDENFPFRKRHFVKFLLSQVYTFFKKRKILPGIYRYHICPIQLVLFHILHRLIILRLRSNDKGIIFLFCYIFPLKHFIACFSGHENMKEYPLLFQLSGIAGMLQHILSRDIYQNPESHLRQTVQPTHTEGMFTAVLKRGISIKNDTVNDAVNDTVNSKEQEVLNIIKQYPGLNSSKIAELIGKVYLPLNVI